MRSTGVVLRRSNRLRIGISSSLRMLKVKIIPAILTDNIEDLFYKIGCVERLVDRVQIDIVGRVFSSQPSIDIEVLEELSAAVALDVQLMVKEPVGFLNRCEWVGVDRVFGQVEHMRSQEDFIKYCFALGMEVGLALDLKTPVSIIEKAISQLDALLLMAVPAGKSGQKFNKAVLKKIHEIRNFDSDISVCVDGGLNPENIYSCIKAGASEFAVGSYLWESKDIEKALDEILEVVS